MSAVDDFINAIVGQESGGNYSAVNSSSGALGKYQVMPSNISQWSHDALGFSITPKEYLNNPGYQDSIARFRLTKYFNAYGARGAAAAWYSGDPTLSESTRAQPGGPSIKGYVDSVMAKVGNSAAVPGAEFAVPGATTSTPAKLPTNWLDWGGWLGSHMWQIGFVIVGGVMIVAGVALYFHHDIGEDIANALKTSEVA